MSEIRDQVIVVTGAAGDMGQAIIAMLAAEGARLAIADCNATRLAELEGRLCASDIKTCSMVLDVTEETGVNDFFAKAKHELGPLDVLLNLPGLSIPGKIADAEVADYDRMFDVNVKGAFLCAKHFVRHVDEAAGGLVINVSSVAAKRANASAPLYCAAKAAVSMLADGLALEVAARNIRVTTLYPGAANTQFWGNRAVPRDKFLKVEEIVEVVRFVLNVPKRVVIHDLAFESFEFWRSK
jgi:NADP-dependent 3-hydroxy acid dehydrogenase YdfG